MPKLDHYRLKRLRELRGFTQGQVATYAGVSSSTISLMEKGERVNPTADVLAGIAEALNTSTDYLLGLTNDPAPSNTSATEPQNEFERELLDVFHRYDEAGQRFILDAILPILEALAKHGLFESIGEEREPRHTGDNSV